MKCPRVACRAPMRLCDHGTYRCSNERCGSTVILSESAAVQGLSTVGKHDVETPVVVVAKPPAAVWVYPPTRRFLDKMCANCLLSFTPNSSHAQWCGACRPAMAKRAKEEAKALRNARAAHERQPQPQMLPHWHPRYQDWLVSVQRAGKRRSEAARARAS